MSDASDSLFPSATTSSSTFTAAPGATTNVLGTAITPPALATRMTVTVAVSSASKFGYVPVGDSACGTLLYFNGGQNLVANSVYTFIVGVRSSRTYNFQLSANVTILDFCVEFTYGYN